MASAQLQSLRSLSLLGIALIGLLCTLAYTLATFALPFMLGLHRVFPATLTTALLMRA